MLETHARAERDTTLSVSDPKKLEDEMRRSGLLTVMVILASVTASQSAFAQLAQYHACTGTDPGNNEVYVYSDADYKGICAALYVGWYPDAGTGAHGFGLPNDSLSSYKVGQGVMLRLFWDGVYGGGPFWVAGTAIGCGWGYIPFIGGHNNCSSDTPQWNDQVSSIKVVDANRDFRCGDMQPGEFAVWSGGFYDADCVVLKYPTGPNSYSIDYPDPVHMGIGNDSITYVHAGPAIPVGSKCPYGGNYAIALYDNANDGGISFRIAAGQFTSLNDKPIYKKTSSLRAYVACNIP